MADNVLIDNGALTDYTVSADEAASGLLQRVKLAYSADGSDTHVPATVDGMLVNLGTNNDVVVTSLPGTVQNDIADMAVAMTNGGLVQEQPIVDTSGVGLPIKYAAVAATADGDNLVVTGVSGKKLRVLGYVLTTTGAGLIKLQDGTATPNILANIRAGVDGGGASYAGGIDAPVGQTAVNVGIEVNCPAGVDVYGHLCYIEVV